MTRFLRYSVPQYTLKLIRRLSFEMLRFSSAEFRAYTDVFYTRYSEAVDWKSGLQDVHFVLYGLVRSLKPQTVVEIGSARGKSTCTMALACRQNGRGMVHSVDPHRENAWNEVGVTGGSFEFLSDRIRKYDLTRHCTIIRSTSQEVARSWNSPIDVLFIDGDHSYEGVKHDFDAFRPWLTPFAVVALHDTCWNYAKDNEYYRKDMGVPRFMAELQQQGYHSTTIMPAPGLTLLNAYSGGFPFLGHTPAQ